MSAKEKPGMAAGLKDGSTERVISMSDLIEKVNPPSEPLPIEALIEKYTRAETSAPVSSLDAPGEREPIEAPVSADDALSARLLERALAYAGLDIPVFPCLPGQKVPAVERGFKDASTDEATIRGWWKKWPLANVAFSPEDAGWCVVDIEHNGIHLIQELELPETFTVKTPRGGRHLFYQGSLPSKVRPFGKDKPFDTRGRGGYVLVPPSVVDGKPYETRFDRDLVELPATFAERIKDSDKRAGDALGNFERDTSANQARARRYLADQIERGEIAVSGQGGNNRTYTTIAWLRDLGLAPATARAILTEPGRWNDACVPPWSGAELDTIIHNVYTYAQNSAGVDAVAPPEETFPAETLARIRQESAAKPAEQDGKIAEMKAEAKARFPLLDENEQAERPEPKWLVKDVLAEGNIVLFIGETGHFKSFLLLDLSLGIANGVKTFGDVPERGIVVYCTDEGRDALGKRRRAAWRKHRGIPVDDPGYFFTVPPPALKDTRSWELLPVAILEKTGHRKPAMVVFDTLSSVIAGENENDAATASLFSKRCRELIANLGGKVVIAVSHHKSDKPNAADYRGTSAWKANTDSFLEVEAKREAKTVKVEVRQHRDADNPERPWTFQGEVIDGELVFEPSFLHDFKAAPADPEKGKRRHGGAITISGHTYTRAGVIQALRELKALDAHSRVSTKVLASELFPPAEPNQDVEAREAELRSIGTGLTRAAREGGLLYGLGFKAVGSHPMRAGGGGDFWWSLEQEPADEPTIH
ncbi:MAG: bifunctional DNA primase/polymerase [Alphaproteobacteria bacterium]